MNRNNYIDPETLCRTIFGLEFPPTKDVLRKKFRELSMLNHPDRGGDAKEFVRVKDAYDVLTSFTEIAETIKSKESEYIEGIHISNFGNGREPAMPECLDCEGLGYTHVEKEFPDGHIRCINTMYCNDGMVPAFRSTVCRDCKGSGEFTLRSERVVDCRKCMGSGTFYIYGKRPVKLSMFNMYVSSMFCPHCKGKGSQVRMVKKHVRTECKSCEKTGEIYLANPVMFMNSMG